MPMPRYVRRRSKTDRLAGVHRIHAAPSFVGFQSGSARGPGAFCPSMRDGAVLRPRPDAGALIGRRRLVGKAKPSAHELAHGSARKMNGFCCRGRTAQRADEIRLRFFGAVRPSRRQARPRAILEGPHL
jgi:hypothetical protein